MILVLAPKHPPHAVAVNAPSTPAVLLFRANHRLSRTYLLGDSNVLSRVVLAGLLRVVRYRPLPLGELLGGGLRVLLFGRHFVSLWSLVLVGGVGDGIDFREFECVPSCPIDTRDRAESCSVGYVTRVELAACGDARGTAAEHHCPNTDTHRRHVYPTAHHLQGRPV